MSDPALIVTDTETDLQHSAAMPLSTCVSFVCVLAAGPSACHVSTDVRQLELRGQHSPCRRTGLTLKHRQHRDIELNPFSSLCSRNAVNCSALNLHDITAGWVARCSIFAGLLLQSTCIV